MNYFINIPVETRNLRLSTGIPYILLLLYYIFNNPQKHEKIWTGNRCQT